MQISKKLAVKILNALDEADQEGKLIKVLGGITGLLQAKAFMDSLILADIDGVETVEVKEADFKQYFKAGSDFKESQGEVFSVE